MWFLDLERCECDVRHQYQLDADECRTLVFAILRLAYMVRWDLHNPQNDPTSMYTPLPYLLLLTAAQPASQAPNSLTTHQS
jgi:hypothetical protein